jgi:hypothetical protein
VRIGCSCSLWSLYIVQVELWCLYQRTGFEFAGASQPPCVTQIIYYLSRSEAPDTRIGKEFGIFTESTMLNNLQSIAKENRNQHLDFPETDQAQYISNHIGIEKLSNQYPVDASYPETRLAYSRVSPEYRTVHTRFTLLFKASFSSIPSIFLLFCMR